MHLAPTMQVHLENPIQTQVTGKCRPGSVEIGHTRAIPTFALRSLAISHARKVAEKSSSFFHSTYHGESVSSHHSQSLPVFLY
jgi:hypothetical protein